MYGEGYTIRGVQRMFALPAEALLFHREVPQTEKTCPGSGIEKASILEQVRATRVPSIRQRHDLPRLPLDEPLTAKVIRNGISAAA